MLISRRTFPPDGFWYFESKTNWPKNPKSVFSGKTFDEAVAMIVQHRLANPRFAHQWSTDPSIVADELDRFCCLRLANNPNYCSGGAAVPQGGASKKGIRQTFATIKAASVGAAVAVKKVVAGAGVLLDWLGDGAKPVSQELANKRAEICVGCPKNLEGDLTSFFTIPAANQIRQQIEIRNDMKLATPFDNKLGICDVCGCSMRLKVWTPIEHILKKLKPENMQLLAMQCWIPKEKQLTSAEARMDPRPHAEVGDVKPIGECPRAQQASPVDHAHAADTL